MPRLAVLCSLSLALTLTTPSLGQITNVTNDQSTPISGAGHDYIHMLAETVNPANGSVSLRLNIPLPAGRRLSVTFAFAYDSNGFWHLTGDGAVPADGGATWLSNTTFLSQGGWSYSVPLLSLDFLNVPYFNGGGTCGFTTDFVFQEAEGSRHALGLSTTSDFQGGDGGAACGLSPVTSAGDDLFKAATSSPTNTVNPPVWVAGPDGTVSYFSGSHWNAWGSPGPSLASLPDSIEDTNGNKIVITDYMTQTQSNRGKFTYTDTLGRTVLSSSGFGSTGNTVSVSDLTGVSSVNWGTAKSSYAINSFALGPQGACNAPPSVNGTQPVVTSISLPNQKTYKFQYDLYDNTGFLSKVTYPNGGYVRYVWGINSLSDVTVYPASVIPNGGGLCNFRYDTPVVVDRYVSFDGVKEVLHQHFVYSTTWPSSTANAWTTKTTTVTTYDLIRGGNFQTIYTYDSSGCGGPASPNIQSHSADQCPVEQTTVYKNWNGSALRTVTKSWQDVNMLLTEQTALENGQTSKIAYTYANNNSMPLVTEKDEYGYGSGAPGALAKKTLTNYASFQTTPIYTFGPSIFNRPSSIVIYGGSGPPVAETDYSYDENNASTVPVSPAPTNHDETHYAASSTAPRGNATTVTHRCLQFCANAVTKYSYDETGQTSSKTNPCGNVTCSDMTGSNHTTNYFYSNSYTVLSGSSNTPYTPPGNTNAYLSKATNPLGQNEAFTYDFNNGQLTAEQNQNDINLGRAGTTFTYNDSLSRLKQSDYADGGQTTYSYNDAVPTVTKTTVIDNTVLPLWVKTTTSQMDGVGHVTEVQLVTDPQGADNTDTKYNGVGDGQVSQRSNPYRPSSSSPTDGTTRYLYDALGRVCLMMPPDVTTTPPANCPTSAPAGDVFTSYSGNCTTVTDEAGKKRKSCDDALGRITKVVEDPNGLNYETDYSYDPLSNLLAVTEIGGNSANARKRSFVYDSLSRLVCASSPETSSAACTAAAFSGHISGTTGYAYDANGNLASKTTPLHNQVGTATVTTNYHYDVLNRLLSKTYTDGTPSVQYGYDGTALSGCATAPPSLSDPEPIGRRTAMCDGSGATSWSHDPMGRTASETRTILGQSAPVTNTTDYEYDVAGNLFELTYPSGTTLNYSHDQANREDFLCDYINNICYVDNTSYAPGGQLTSYSGGDNSSFAGITRTTSYNNRLQPTAISATTSASTIYSLGYAYGPAGQDNGNVSTITNNLDATRTVTVNYDSLNRIQNALTTNWGEAYTIDAWGNMTAINSYQGLANEPFSCGPANLKNQLNTCYGYDSAGNLVSNAPATYTYDAENRLVSTAGWTYVYDGEGNRVRKFSSGGGKLYWPNTTGEVLGETDQTGNPLTDYVFFSGQRIARFDPTTLAVHYYFSDHLGTNTVVTNAIGTCEQDIEFYPYGGQRKDYCSTQVVQNYKFTGKERDSESNLDNFGARYYGSSMGRFMTADDPFSDQQPEEPQSWNLYGYVRNNPINATDPDGKACVKGADGKEYDDDRGGETCAQVALNDQLNSIFPQAIVIATPIDTLQDIPANQLATGVANLTTGSDVAEVVENGFSDAQLVLGAGELAEFASGLRAEAQLTSARMAAVRASGKAGELAARIIKNTEHIESVTGAAYRVPDVLDHINKVIGEVKNFTTTKLALTKQLQDDLAYSQKYGYKMVLYLRGGAQAVQMTGPLQKLVNSGVIQVIPF